MATAHRCRRTIVKRGVEVFAVTALVAGLGASGALADGLAQAPVRTAYDRGRVKTDDFGVGLRLR